MDDPDSPFLSFRSIAAVAVVGTYVLMVLGAYTSAVGAGLSCPDWPTCYGVWVPFLHPEIIANSPYSAGQILVEWTHRGLAMVMGVVIVGTAAFAWWEYRDDLRIVAPAVLAAVLLPIQILLGGLTVTQSLEPIVVTGHLGVAVLILMCLLITTITAWNTPRPR